MKKKSTSQSAFFNLRVLAGLSIVLVGVFVALAGLGVFSATAASLDKALRKNKIITSSTDPLVPVGFDCSKIHQLGIDRQENLRAGAIMLACGEAQGGSPHTAAGGPVARLVQKFLAPLTYGAADVDLVNHPETFPNITQSETYTLANPDNPNQVLVAYNDSRGRNASPINISAASVSTDGGVTFDRLTLASGQGPFANTSGDPVALFHKPTQTWFTVWLDGACAGGGLGGYKSTTPEVATSWTHFTCVHNGSSDDRESGWSDNNTASPFYGRMYVSWNDFAVGGGALEVTYSSDAGNTWHAPVTVSNTGTFIRDTQITGDLSGNGVIYIAGMDEGGGGFPHNDINHIYKSTDGGNTWANTYTGTAFPGPGVTASGYFACMFNPAYWRHEGWGEPAAFNNVVSLVYAQQGGTGDPGDVYYIRSTDGGVTFGAPFKLNTDSTTRPQWQPNLSVSPAGTLLATWYDARESTTCTQGNPSVPCYRMWSRKSADNGLTWQPDMPLSDVVSPLPAQPDPGIVGVYVGDYDYGSATVAKHVTSWADGRVAINSQSQQDAFTDRELVGFSVTTTTPACGSVINTQPLDFVINLSDAVNPGTVQATDFTVNGTPANSFVLGGGNTQITFHFNSSPVVTQGVQTMHIPAGAFTRASDGMPNFDFTCTFCYAATALQVTSTNPPVGGTFTPAAPGNYDYLVNFNQAVDPASVQDSDLMLTGVAGGTVVSHTLENGNTTVHFILHFSFGGSVTASIGTGAITAQTPTCSSNAAFSGMYTVQGCPPADYTTTTATDTLIPGGTDIGNHCDDCFTQINLPFPVTVYGTTVSVAYPASNGDLHLANPGTKSFYYMQCVPINPGPPDGPFLNTLLPYYDDLRTDDLATCPDCGIFTQTQGTAPNRRFVIRWKTTYFNFAGTAEFEVVLTEGSGTLSVIYGATANSGATAASGIQQDLTRFTSFSCFQAILTPNLRVNYVPPTCTLSIVGAVSRKIHGAAGTFDIALPLTGTDGVECRTTGGTNDYTMVVTFSGNVTVTGSPQAQVTSGTGCVGSGGVCTGNVTVSGNVVTVLLTTVTNAQNINVRINGVNGAGSDAPATDFNIPMGVLAGDTNANRTVNAADIAQTKARLGQTVDGTNFRSDVNANGSINAADVAIIKGKSGTSIP